MTINHFKRKHIVVIGGGFGGLNFIASFYNNKYYDVTLVDKNNYNYFTPLLYQVATGFLAPSSISYPFRKLFKNKNIAFRMADVNGVDASKNKIHLDDGSELSYDLLVLAAGTKTNFLENKSLRARALSLKGINDALVMRNELIGILEKASIEKDPEERKRLLTIVIAGGGPTGVEVAGVLAEVRKYIYAREYPELKDFPFEIYIVDGSPFLLAPMSDKSHQTAYNTLTKLDVHIILKTHVVLFENEKVFLSNGDIIECKTLIWSAGVIANSFEGIAESSLGKGRRMITNEYNQVQGYENIYAIGDISIQFDDADYPDGHPQLAQPAIQQGKALAKNLLRVACGQQMKAFKYFDKGEMAIIGRQNAVADLFKHRVHFGGLPGLMAWLLIHLMSLVSTNNKIKTFYNWAFAYLTNDQTLRMIFRTESADDRI
ncbi:NAD(P)/FAD-dependent oxidoreductase [Mucilaginibacter sabulilitoris]|uniref:NADH:ubiquinone reductase (non-electrogenic) n=1 Tax=Mucilaginibacter sabulilitoris TaxID=1173583 RepID=A0ABZ0TEK2_9SPHI|nr:NAD(P)/FAD-dependent oxidoreductase [Mucilaginibacter sabulilitoris]WPU90936.1 NAD(P)/FAD-dependent oxidoreductase [Mucilaginibacter sabulilitoris]